MTSAKRVVVIAMFLALAGGLGWTVVENRRLAHEVETLRAEGEAAKSEIAARREQAEAARRRVEEALAAMIPSMQHK